ncbi:MAG TPA: PLDc N-terminal domain-containing protein [Geobacteraceae bacterium]
METLKFGLMLTIIPFSLICLFITIWWALVDMSVRKVTGLKRAIWSMVVILLPPVGAILYNFLVRQPAIAGKCHPSPAR